MSIFFSIVGCIAVVFFSCAAFLEAFVKFWDRIIWLHEDHVSKKVGQRILSEAYWFSENGPAMKALQAVGEQLRDRGSFGADDARGIWRRKMAEETKP